MKSKMNSKRPLHAAVVLLAVVVAGCESDGYGGYDSHVSVGVGYTVDWGSVFAVWRYLDYRFKSGEPIDSMSMSGPVIGVAFQW